MNLVEEVLWTVVIFGSQPEVFEVLPQNLHDIEMGRVDREVEQKQTARLPNFSVRLDQHAFVQAGIIQHHDGGFVNIPRQFVQLLHHEGGVNCAFGGGKAAGVGAGEKGKATQARPSLGG